MNSLRNIPEVIFEGCSSIQSFNGFDQSILPRKNRKVTLSMMDLKDCDLSGLGNIGVLELNSVRNLDDGKGVHDIDHLIIDKIVGSFSFTNYHQIHRIDIRISLDLKSLDGLQGVPIVSLLLREAFEGSPAINFKSDPFEVLPPLQLQGCEQVYCHESLLIAQEAKKYVQHPSSTPFAVVFETIKEFYVVSYSGADSYFFESWEEYFATKARVW
jgi:hypothetical protein